MFSSIPESKDDPVGFGIPEDGGPRLELCSNLPGVPGGRVQGVDGEDVGQHQEELHVSQLSSGTDSRPDAVG